MASTYLTRTLVNSNQKKFTISVWLKRSKLGAQQSILGVGGGAAYATHLYFDGSDRIDFWNYFNSAYQGRKTTNRRFRDTNAWYHIVAAVDTTSAQSTADDRMKIYVNGVRETSFSTSSNPNQDQTFEFSSASVHQIGRNSGGDEFDGCMSHFHFVDGSQLEPTVFGETDATTGEWKIKTSPSYTAGTNGFWVLKDGNSVTDSSTNSNDFTVAAGTLTKSEDNPSNVFCTMNPLDKSSSLNLSNGNTRTASPSNSWMPCKATIGMMGQNGKFYWEGKCESGTYHYFGVYDASGTVRGSEQSEMDNNRFVYVYDGGMQRTITGQSAIASGTYATFANTDIIGVALDKENGTITFYKNGTQIYTETHSSLQTKDLIAGTQAYGSDIQWNFGNGYFGTTAISSEGTNASGIGKFEYDVPTGYTALSTKGLNE